MSIPMQKAGPLTLCLLQATLFDPQLHDGSCICERVASIVDGEQRGREERTRAELPGTAGWVGPTGGKNKDELVI
jgi:hypothetical protein